MEKSMAKASEAPRCGTDTMLTMVEAGQNETSNGEGKRGRPRSETAHRAVLEAVAELLNTQGCAYEELTIERIAAVAGVGKQTIYRWWPNKAAVVLEALLSGYVKLDFAPVPDTGDLRADLMTWVELADANEREQGLGDSTVMARSLIAALSTSGEETQQLLHNSALWEDMHLTARIRAAAAAGELREGLDPEHVAAALMDPVILRTITTGRPGVAWMQGLVDVVLSGALRQE